MLAFLFQRAPPAPTPTSLREAAARLNIRLNALGQFTVAAPGVTWTIYEQNGRIHAYDGGQYTHTVAFLGADADAVEKLEAFVRNPRRVRISPA